MAKKKTKTVKPKAVAEEAGELYYVVNVYDNHGTININQTGNPPPPPCPPGGCQ